LFEQDPSPSFALIDNVGGGLQWTTLRTLPRGRCWIFLPVSIV
jgi:hypothetical protein